MLSKDFWGQHFDLIFLFGFDTAYKWPPKETVCMQCQMLFSGKNKKKNIWMSSSQRNSHYGQAKLLAY